MKPEIHTLLAAIIKAPVECDGFVRLAHAVLRDAGIEHKTFIGSLVSTDGQRQVPVHCWIELPDSCIIDFRARMWLGESESVPHGIFMPTSFPDWQYKGRGFDVRPIPPFLAQILMADIASQV